MRWRIHIVLILSLVFLLLINHPHGLTATKEKSSTQESGESSERKPDSSPPMARSKESSEKPYTFLVEKNIFSPERKEFPMFLAPSGPAQKPPLVRPQVILYGVTLAGEYQSASIAQQGRPLRKGEREMITLKLGEKIGDYKLTKILPDRIVFETEEDRFEVLLYDATKPKPRAAIRTETKPATITSSLPSPTPATPQPSTPLPQVSPPGKQEIQKPMTSTPLPSPPLPSQERFVTPPMPTPPPQPVTPSVPPPYSPRRRIPLPTSPGTSSAVNPQTLPNEPGGP